MHRISSHQWRIYNACKHSNITKYSSEQLFFFSQSKCKAMRMINPISPYISQTLGSDRRKLKLDDQTEMIRGKGFVRKSSQRPEISLRQQRQTTQQLQSSSALCQHNTNNTRDPGPQNQYKNKLLIDMIGQYLAEIQLFENRISCSNEVLSNAY